MDLRHVCKGTISIKQAKREPPMIKVPDQRLDGPDPSAGSNLER